MKSDLLALGAILLWASLATLASQLSHVPPFLLTGLGLLVGSLISLPLSKFNFGSWRLPKTTILVGVYGLFGYHFLLFIALQTAPAVEANLVNYLWPLLIVVLAPAILKGNRLRLGHILGAAAGFAGAAIAILSAGQAGGGNAAGGASQAGWLEPGYLFALGAAVIWATYSLLTKRVPHFATSAIGLFAGVSGLLALGAHFLLETPVALTADDWLLIGLLGLGPLGGAFYLWDAALKTGDARRIGLLAFLTPLLSTALLLLATGRPLSWPLGLATVLIVGGALAGSGFNSGRRASAKVPN